MSLFTMSPEVAAAKEAGTPIVALESTIITHGMPYPQNVDVARRVEATVREHGATPATIAVMNGVLHIGLDDDQLEALATAKDVMKVSRADMPVCMAAGRTGATTVAATMIGAHLADIKVFATGGIGGVHKGAELALKLVYIVFHELASLTGLPQASNRSGGVVFLALRCSRLAPIRGCSP